jgi:colanic acid/amylovoran biosynthesis protein
MAQANTVSIVGVTGFRNRGVEALLHPIVTGISAMDPHSRICVFTATPDFDRRRMTSGSVSFHHEGCVQPVYTRAGRILRRVGLRAKEHFPGWDELLNSQLVVVTGGDIFSSEYGDASLSRHLLPIRLANAAGIPVILLAQSIGPFQSQKQAQAWLAVCSQAAHISTRESRTY